IRDPWIPVVDIHGEKHLIRPSALSALDVDGTTLKFVRPASPRSDFNGALWQFLIGILQTAFHELEDEDWADYLITPPSPEVLEAKLSVLEPAFELDGPSPRFMQDFAPQELGETPLPCANLLIDSPGANGIKLNTDLFIKRAHVEKLCLSCAAQALFTLQTNAPSGGSGHRTSLRGGGPLSTLVHAEKLWHKVWLNVLLSASMKDFGQPTKSGEPLTELFPWLSPTRTSDQAGTERHPAQLKATHVYWATPRRISLLVEDLQARCDICMKTSERMVRHYLTKNYGANYEGWRHPLTPTQTLKTGLNPIKANPGCLLYRHWDIYTQAVSDKDRDSQPARVVEALNGRWHHPDLELPTLLGTNPRFHVFGYDMDNMKARCWYEGYVPSWMINSEHIATFQTHLRCHLQTADLVMRHLRTSVRDAWYKTGREASLDKELFESVSAAFWQETEGAFIESVNTLSKYSSPDELNPIKEKWLERLQQAALFIYDAYTQMDFVNVVDPERLIMARQKLRRMNGGAPVRERLGLPPPPEAASSPRAPKKASKEAGKAI
ncbi:MAG: type I-E CRISPR-associated protein Cse1/CasA, partial [Myxococcota bacterium]